MLSFRDYLLMEEYISPDYLYSNADQRRTFIYNRDGTIYYGNDTHTDITKYDDYDYDHQSLRGRVGTWTGDPQHSPRIPGLETRPPGLETLHQLQIVSFWNVGAGEKEIFDKLLMPCLQRLKADEEIDDNTLLSTPFLRDAVPVSKMGNAKSIAPTPEKQQQIALMQQLHLMRPEQKKAVLGQIGKGMSPWKRVGIEKMNNPYIKSYGENYIKGNNGTRKRNSD
jgi:hypothetical protein